MNELQPISKRIAFEFWISTEFDIPQFPGESGWVKFGFCTRQTKREQAQMMSMYKRLLKMCSFNEFCSAIRYSTMIALFDKYGFEQERKEFRYFQSVMENSKALPSVWYLKSFVYDAMTVNLSSSLRAVAIDYGFNHCRDATGRSRLRQACREVFDRGVDELLLHEACLAGRIFDICSSFCPTWTSTDREYFQELMVNPYPLQPPVPWAGLVVENLAFCKESDKELVGQKMAMESSDSILFVIDDALEGDMLRMMGEFNSYRLEEDPHRFQDQDNSIVQLSPEESRRAHYVVSIDPVTGCERHILVLAPREQMESE